MNFHCQITDELRYSVDGHFKRAFFQGNLYLCKSEQLTWGMAVKEKEEKDENHIEKQIRIGP